MTPSASFLVRVGYPREVLAGHYLQGPRDPKQVKSHGYGFTLNRVEAWPFNTEKSAAAKARIVDRHMGWGEGVSVVEITLGLVLTHHWFDEIEADRKGVEYREMSDLWRRLIWDRRENITAVRFSRGSTSRTLVRDVAAITIGPCPIPGWSGDYYRLHLARS